MATGAEAGPVVVQRMRHWLADTDLTGVRGEKALAALPEQDQDGWRKLWAAVENLLAEAQ